MTARTTVHGLQVATELHRFIDETGAARHRRRQRQVLAAASTPSCSELAPEERRAAGRARPPAVANSTPGTRPTPARSATCRPTARFLEQIGYLVPPPAGAKATTANVDAELALQAGPQLVVPILNARYALNAANARWGSLYDALYGTDVIPETDGAEKGKGYNPVRGAKVIAYRAQRAGPGRAAGRGLAHRRHRLPGRRRQAGRDAARTARPAGLKRRRRSSSATRASPAAPSSVLLQHNGLHIDIRIDRGTRHRQDRRRPASATWCSKRRCPPSSTWKTRSPWSTPTTRCWPTATGWASCKGTLTEQVDKGGKTFTRGLNADRELHGPTAAAKCTLHGRSLMFVRNVGHLMTNPAILYDGGKEIPEGILDAVITTTIALHDLQAQGPARHQATRAPARSTSSSPRCTARPKWPSPASCSAASKRCWACPPTPSSWASWTRSAAPAST